MRNLLSASAEKKAGIPACHSPTCHSEERKRLGTCSVLKGHDFSCAVSA